MKKFLGIILISLAISGCTNVKPKTSETITAEVATSTVAVETASEESAETKENSNYSEGLTIVNINGHEYSYDAVSGATTENKEAEAKQYTPEEKEKLMFWSAKPPIGFVEGDYYKSETLFDEGYKAIIEAVRKDGKLVMVELDEQAPDDYYAPEWAGVPKRLSGYANFQASKDRTNNTLVTWVNGMTFLEHQMLTDNRLSGDFKTVKGSSNSARKGFLPAAEELEKEFETTSGKYYYSLTREFEGGLVGRIEVIKENDKIIFVKYDEIFEDNKDDIKDEKLKELFRQSKHDSIYYKDLSGKDFKVFANSINESTVASNSILEVSDELKTNEDFKDELANYTSMANELNELMKK